MLDENVEGQLFLLERLPPGLHHKTLDVGFVGDKRGMTPATGLILTEWVICHQWMFREAHIMNDEGANYAFFGMVDLHSYHAQVHAYPPKKTAMQFPRATIHKAGGVLKQYDRIVDACNVLLVATDRDYEEFPNDPCWRAARRAERQDKTVICFYPQAVVGPSPWNFELPEQPGPIPIPHSLIEKAKRIAGAEEE